MRLIRQTARRLARFQARVSHALSLRYRFGHPWRKAWETAGIWN